MTFLRRLQMKRRAQTPDSYTYSLLFRGFAKHVDREPSILTRALRIYHSMFSDNSPVAPTTIHTNSMLQICAKAKDVDTMFAIAAKLPEKGRGAPDNLTFTTIMNAIRVMAWTVSSTSVETEKQKHDRRYKAVLQGRRMWVDVVGQWRLGHMIMDEDLVCAMGRLLLLGDTAKDYDDVLSLLEQTMRLRRLMPRLGDPVRQNHPQGSETTPDTTLQLQQNEETTKIPARDSDSDVVVPISKLHTPSREIKDTDSEFSSELEKLAPSSISRIYAIPGRNTLSLVMDACTRMRATRAAQGYWEKITREVEADLENYHMYLRVLRVSRASSMAVDLVANMVTPRHSSGLDVGAIAKTFRIGMSACNRDSNNPSSLKNGVRLVRLMQNTLETMDVRTIEMFQQLIRTRYRENLWVVEDMCDALEALHASFLNVKSAMVQGNWKGSHGERKVERSNGRTFESSDIGLVHVSNKGRHNVSSELLSESSHEDDAMKIAKLVEMECSRAINLYGEQLPEKLKSQWQHMRSATTMWMSKQSSFPPERKQHTNEALKVKRSK